MCGAILQTLDIEVCVGLSRALSCEVPTSGLALGNVDVQLVIDSLEFVPAELILSPLCFFRGFETHEAIVGFVLLVAEYSFGDDVTVQSEGTLNEILDFFFGVVLWEATDIKVVLFLYGSFVARDENLGLEGGTGNLESVELLDAFLCVYRIVELHIPVIRQKVVIIFTYP